MRRHVRWIVLLLSAPLTFLVLMLLAGQLSARPPDSDDPAILWIALLVLLLFGSAFAVPVVLIVLAIVEMRRTFRRAQRAKGRFTAGEREMLAAGRRSAEAWDYARHARQTLLAREVPGTIDQWDVVPHAGECFLARLTLTYARYYGTDVAYQQTSMFAFGRPAFIVGALAVSAIANGAARSRAMAQAAPQWREWQTAVTYVTNHRLVVNAGGRWLTFDYAAMTAVYPEAGQLTLVCQFGGTEPLLLSGDEAPIAAVFTLLQTFGVDALRSHPSMGPLDVPASEPELPPVGGRRRGGVGPAHRTARTVKV